MDILERAKAHYVGAEPQRLDVPEWGAAGKPLIVTFTPLTVAERRRIYKADKQGRPVDGPTAAVRCVMLKACDEKGKRLFDEMAEHDLMHNVDSTVIGKIAGAILIDLGDDIDATIETEKNV